MPSATVSVLIRKLMNPGPATSADAIPAARRSISSITRTARSRGFTPRRLDALTGNVSRVAATIVDDIVDAGECDAVTAISARLSKR